MVNTDKWVYVCWRKREREKKNNPGGGGWRGAEGLLGSAFFFSFFFFFSVHNPDKDRSVLLATHSGRRPHDSSAPISRVTPGAEKGALARFVYICLFCQGTPLINSLIPKLGRVTAIKSPSTSRVCFQSVWDFVAAHKCCLLTSRKYEGRYLLILKFDMFCSQQGGL